MSRDFGLAIRFQPGVLMRGPMVGTPGYVAPEMMKGCYDERADVWSLGIVLHQLLTGEFPVYIQNLCQELERNENFEKVPFFFRAVKDCPDELDLTHPMYAHLSEGARSLLVGMLKKKPDQRLTLPEVRAHPWLHPLVAATESQESNDSVSVRDLKRTRFTMQEVNVPEQKDAQQAGLAMARMGHIGPVVVPEKVQLTRCNLLPLPVAAY